MLTLTSPDLPSVAAPSSAGAPIAHISGTFTAGSLGVITFSSGVETESTEAIALPASTNGIITVTPPSTVNNVASVTIDDVVYTPTKDEEGTPSTGKFHYEPSTNTLSVNAGDATPTTGTAAQYKAFSPSYSVSADRWTGEIPSFLNEWNISGSIGLNRSFEGSPSGSLEFTTAADNERSVRTTLRNGKKVVLFGRGYAVSDLQFNDDGQGNIDVSVNLQGAHDIALDNNVLLRSNSSTTSVSLSTLAQRAGTAYRGPAINVPIDREASLKATTTLGSELARARASRGFAFYSNPDQVEIRQWGATKLHTISDADIMSGGESPLTKAYSGQGNEYKTFQLSDEYLNRELLLDLTDTAEDGEGNGRKNTVRTIVTGDRIITAASLQLDLREPNNSFDLGGQVLTRTTTQYRNEIETWVETEEFGYAYAASQVYDISVQIDTDPNNSFANSYTAVPVFNSVNATGRFMKVRTKLTRTFFDSDNYLIKRTIRVRELKRYQSETNAKETLGIKAAIATGQSAANTASLLTAYEEFFWTERIDTEEWTLKQYAAQYPDFDPTQFDYKPKFELQRRRRDRIFETKPVAELATFSEDPKNPSDLLVFIDAPPLVTGSDFRDEAETTIISPSSDVTRSAYRPEKDAFKVTQRTNNIDGAGLQQSLAIAQSEDRLGRPSEHTRMPEYDEDGEVSGNAPDESNVTLLMRTPNTGLTDDDPIEGTISFPGGDTVARAIAAAETDISILNTQGVETVSTLLHPSRRYDEGDLISWNGGIYVVLSIAEEFNVETAGVMSVSPWSVTLGRFMQPAVTVSEIPNA
ncbi:MAG: hypothetical protein AAF327_14005 [Cyanobacteria bacterium P01_A01_bin.37]